MAARVVIGSRGSRLALWQAEWAKATLLSLRPELQVEIEVIQTRGDRILDAPFASIGGKGIFTKEIEQALLDGRIDLAVHSLKDLPTELPPGLVLGAVSPRADVRDALVSRNGFGLDDLPRGSRVGTSSLRRQAQLLHLRPDLVLEGIRGNVETRLSKLETEGLDGVMLAAAGLERLGFRDRVTEFLPPDRIIPAPGQGALGIETREGDVAVAALVAGMEDRDTRLAVTAERTLLEVLGGGCQVPIGAWARLEENQLVVDGIVALPDGSRAVRDRVDGPADDPVEVGRRLADRLISQGAEQILQALA